MADIILCRNAQPGSAEGGELKIEDLEESKVIYGIEKHNFAKLRGEYHEN